MNFGHLLTLSGLTYSEVSSVVPLVPSACKSVVLTIVNTYYIQTVIYNAISIRITRYLHSLNVLGRLRRCCLHRTCVVHSNVVPHDQYIYQVCNMTGAICFRLDRNVIHDNKIGILCRLHSFLTQVTHSLPLRRLMSYIYGAPILDVSRSHTTTQHSR